MFTCLHASPITLMNNMLTNIVHILVSVWELPHCTYWSPTIYTHNNIWSIHTETILLVLLVIYLPFLSTSKYKMWISHINHLRNMCMMLCVWSTVLMNIFLNIIICIITSMRATPLCILECHHSYWKKTTVYILRCHCLCW